MRRANLREKWSEMKPDGKIPINKTKPPKKETYPTIKSEPPIALTKMEKRALINNPKLDWMKMLESIASLIFRL